MKALALLCLLAAALAARPPELSADLPSGFDRRPPGLSARPDAARDSLNFRLIGKCPIPGYAVHLAVQDSIVCVAADSGLFVVNASDPAAPVLVGRLATPPRATGIALRGEYAYVTCRDSGLRIIDIADPARPRQVGHYDTPYWAIHVTVVETLAFVADFVAGLRVINVANPARPYEIGFNLANRGTSGVDVVGNRAYLADASRLSIVDVSDPANPVLLGSCSTNYARYVTVIDTFAFVADAREGMRVVSVADPARPRTLTSYPAAFAAHVQSTAGRVYLATTERLVTFDPDRPGNPQADGYYDMVAVASAVSGSLCHVATGSEGLWILGRGGATVAEPFPPGAPGGLRGATVIRGILNLQPATWNPLSAIVLLDASGRRVMDLRPGDNDVRHLPPGVYFLCPAPAGSARLVRLR